jgi:predicted dehydrogenase
MTARVGLVGLGVISRFYAAAFQAVPGVRLVAVCDLDEAALEPYQGRLACYRDHAELIRSAGVDAVVVNVPNDGHHGICRDALAAGLAVCVEKPLAVRLDHGRMLTRLAEARGVPLLTAFHRRYNSNVLALLGRIRDAAPVASMTVRYLERIEDHVGRDRWYLDPQRCGGGCVADNGPNAFDLARLFLGRVELVDAVLSRDAAGIDRQARVTLQAAAGARVGVELDWSYGAGECKDVTVVLADGRACTANLLAGHAGFKGSLWHEYVGVLREFAALLSTGRPRRPDPDGRGPDGLAALELVHQVYRSEHAGSPTGGGAR